MHGFKFVLTDSHNYGQWCFVRVIRTEPATVVVQRHVTDRDNSLPPRTAIDFKPRATWSLDITRIKVVFLYRIWVADPKCAVSRRSDAGELQIEHSRAVACVDLFKDFVVSFIAEDGCKYLRTSSHLHSLLVLRKYPKFTKEILRAK